MQSSGSFDENDHLLAQISLMKMRTILKGSVYCFLLLNVAIAQRSTSTSDTSSQNGDGPVTKTDNGQQLPIPYQQPYLGYYQGPIQQPSPYPGPPQPYPLPGGNGQPYYYPVLNNNNIRRDENHNNDPHGGGRPRTFYPGAGNNFRGQHGMNVGVGNDPYPHIQAEIIDVDPEYQRQLLGPIIHDEGAPNPYHGGGGPENYQHHRRKPVHYIVKTSGSTSNYTNIPQQNSKPLITKNSYSTTIRRTFVNDPSKPQKPINLHFINGVQVNTERSVIDGDTDPEATTVVAEDVNTTTENENPQATNTSLQGRRFLDVPKTCPTGTKIAHNGQCLETFQLAIPFQTSQNNTVEATEATTEATTTIVAADESE